MISDKSKKRLEDKLKNVEVVKNKRKLDSSAVEKVPSRNLEDLKKKFLATDNNSQLKKLKNKFLKPIDPPAAVAADDSEHTTGAGDDDVEVGLIKKKNQDASVDSVDERTVVISKKNGMMGAQG
jgi:hypothetical protein